MKNCKHGFNPMDGPGLWCPACEADEQKGSLLHRIWMKILYTLGLRNH